MLFDSATLCIFRLLAMLPASYRFAWVPAALVVLLCSAVLLGCGEDDDGATAPDVEAAEDIEDPIPFEKHGTLHVLQDDDTLSTFDIEIADTDSARARGLMDRASLPDDSGMLFLFDEEAPQSFWMANTPLSLDILFADSDSTVVSIAKYTTPFSQDQVESGDPAKYVLELPAGEADRRGILEGDRFTWTRDE